jgi:hypothetical protein
MAVALFSSAWANPTSRIIGVGADPLQFIWFFTWPAYALTHGQNPFITRAIDYPSGVNLMWNSSSLLIGLVTWPVRALFGPILNFNLVETLAPALSAWTAFLWIRRKVSHPVAAALGAALFGFSPGMLGQLLGHPHVAAAFRPPLMLILLEDMLIFDRRSPVVAGALLGLMGAAQLLIGEEVLVVTALIAFLGIGVLAGMYPSRLRERLPRAAAGLIVAGGVFIVLSAAPLAIQFFGPERLNGLVHAKDTYVADLLSFVTPDQQQWLAPGRFVRLFSRFAGSSLAESDAYLGVPLILLLLFIAIRHWDRPAVRVATTLAVLLGALSLGGTIHVAGHATPIPSLALVVLIPWFWRALPVPAVVATFTIAWLALNRVPFLANVLAVRLTIFIYLFTGLLLAVFVDAMLNRARRQRAVGVVALLVALVPLTPALPYSAFSAEVPAYFTLCRCFALQRDALASHGRHALCDAQRLCLRAGVRASLPQSTPQRVVRSEPGHPGRGRPDDARHGRRVAGHQAVERAAGHGRSNAQRGRHGRGADAGHRIAANPYRRCIRLGRTGDGRVSSCGRDPNLTSPSRHRVTGTERCAPRGPLKL